MDTIQIIGHKNPDTDATLSALIMQDFLTQKGYNATAYIQGELNKETLYLLETYNIEKPEIKNSLDSTLEVCLVDHNETSQSIDNLAECSVTWVIDHHKIDFKTSSPLNMRVEALCSTASILYKMYQESGFKISAEIATMMLACMMSDSLFWKSPTSTLEDKEIAKKLQEISGILDLEAFAMPMFHAKSDLGDMPIKEVIQYDYKIFDINGQKCGIGSLETTNPSYAFGRKQEIILGLKELKTEQHLDFIMLSIVDILAENNTTFILEEDAAKLEAIFGVRVQDNEANLGNRISRKKQLAPQVTDYFNSLS